MHKDESVTKRSTTCIFKIVSFMPTSLTKVLCSLPKCCCFAKRLFLCWTIVFPENLPLVKHLRSVSKLLCSSTTLLKYNFSSHLILFPSQKFWEWMQSVTQKRNLTSHLFSHYELQIVAWQKMLKLMSRAKLKHMFPIGAPGLNVSACSTLGQSSYFDFSLSQGVALIYKELSCILS